jgi:hypothetical protein
VRQAGLDEMAKKFREQGEIYVSPTRD